MSDVQAYLRAVLADNHQLYATDYFDVFLHDDSDHPFSNYAIPRDGAEPTEDAIHEMIVVMEGAKRVPRLEYLPATAPAAEEALLAQGFVEELRTPLMSCTAGKLKEVEVPEKVTLHQLGPDSEGEEVNGYLSAVSGAFGEPFDPATSDTAAVSLLRRIAVVAYADGEIAGGGSCQTIIAGTTELVGIGVAEPYRKRGIAAAVTAEIARLAFGRGAGTAFLTPGSDATARVYERAGFEATDEMLHLVRRG